MSEPNEPGTEASVDAPVISMAALTREATLRRLSELARSGDAAPAPVAEAATSAFAWRSIDDELAALAYDSEQDDDLAGVRAEPGSRQLTFAAPGIVIEVEVTLRRPRELLCQVVPPQAARLEVRLGRGTLGPQTDEDGTFHVPAVPPGPVSLRCQPLAGSASSVATSWIRI